MLTAYLNRQVGRESESAKQPCRDRVGAYLLDHHDPGPLRLFSFPSVNWSFERQMEACYAGKSSFVGVERDVAVIHQGMKWMPGTVPHWFTEELRGQRMHGVRTDRATVLHTDVATFGRIGRAEIGSRGRRRLWKDRYEHWTAAWLDFTAQISSQVELVLPTLGCACDWDCLSVPVAVTVMKGRECPQVTGKLRAFGDNREGYLIALLGSNRFRRFEPDQVFEYQSDSSTPMLTLCGRLISRVDGDTRLPSPQSPAPTEAEVTP